MTDDEFDGERLRIEHDPDTGTWRATLAPEYAEWLTRKLNDVESREMFDDMRQGTSGDMPTLYERPEGQ